MSKYLRTLLVGIALLGLNAQVYAQANDVDCFKCIDAPDIAGEAVTTYKIRPQAVTTSRIAKQAVTTNRIAGGAVSTSKIKNGAVTENKLSADLSNAMLGTRNPRVLDGGDNLIGYLVNISDDSWSVDVLTEQGYVFNGVAFNDGQSLYTGTIWYSGGSCTGTAYTDLPNGFVRLLYDETGTETLYYTDKNSAAQASPSILSMSGNGGCSAFCCAIGMGWPVLPNNPGVTGVSNQAYPVPIKIEYTQ
jgi:hypothetical protein